MNGKTFSERIKVHVDEEISKASDSIKNGNTNGAFHHLERAHILGQAVTVEHTRVHWRMLKIGWQRRDYGEIFGQIVRLVGAATKTPFGIYPKGNTGGANVWFFKPLPVPKDLSEIIDQAGE